MLDKENNNYLYKDIAILQFTAQLYIGDFPTYYYNIIYDII